MIILEGGNVFKDANGQPLTQRINLADVKPTVQQLEKLTGLSLLDNMLGSTGNTATSGDLDLAVDVVKITKDQLIQSLKAKGIDDKDIAKSGDSVHYKAPINGDPKNGYVQTDFMFGNPVWQKFSLNVVGNSEFKGVHRHILLASIAKARGLKWSYKYGLIIRDSNKVLSVDPDEIAKILIGGTRKDIGSVETIIAKAKQDPEYETLVADAKESFARDGLVLEDSNDANFMARLRDRIVSQGMQVIIEGARIEHPEDMIFDRASQGALNAIATLRSLPAQAENITIKWDGRPAIIFGRNTQGQFVLTDKSGFTAKGYNGLATSPAQLEKIMQQRGGERGDLVNMYKTIWPALEAQTPEGMKGYLMGDLLYVGKPNESNGKYTFTPNTVSYAIDKDTDLGQQIDDSVAALAVHTFKKNPEDPGVPFSDIAQLGQGRVLILGPKMSQTPSVDVPEAQLNELESTIRKNSGKIDVLFNPASLREFQLANLPALMKQYGNEKVRQGNFSNMAQGFLEFATTKVTPQKLERLTKFLSENERALELVFTLFRMIGAIKTRIVRQLDGANSGIEASIDGEPGHEGYVTSGIKLVDRLRFSKSNFAKNSQ